MKVFNVKKESAKYTIYGALFGLAFPLISFIIITFVSKDVHLLFYIICSAPLFLGLFSRFAGVRQDRINEINRGLEAQVRSRTKAIRNMMDVSGQGFLTFGADLTVHEEYSKACEDILKQNIAGKKVEKLLFSDETRQNDFREGFSLFFSKKAKSDVIFNLMEKELTIGKKDIQVEYKVINDEEILCTLTDITLERVMAEQKRQDYENRNIIMQVITHQKYFSSFLMEADELFEKFRLIDSTHLQIDYEELQRAVHTFKGNASFFNFNKTKDAAHELEYYINDHLILNEPIDLGGQTVELKQQYYSELKVVQDTLGSAWMNSIDAVSIPTSHYRRLEAYIRKKYSPDKKLIQTIEYFRKIPLADMFVRFPDMATRLAESLGKRLNPVVITGGQFRVLPDPYEPLINTLVHIIRNCIDHGIEQPRERELKNKPPEGNISIHLETSDGKIIISFTDDGKGISLLSIEKRAAELGLIRDGEKKTTRELINFIFHQSFSTAEHVTETSGRGVGLSAVKEEIDKLHGKISISTKPNQGTTFTIVLPKI